MRQPAALAPFVLPMSLGWMAAWWLATLPAIPLLVSDILYLIGVSHPDPSGFIAYPTWWWLTLGAAYQVGTIAIAVLWVNQQRNP